MMASTSVGLNMKIGMSGCPETIPSASDLARSSTGYLRDKVRNGGAGGCGLSPVLPMAWQREQFSRKSTSPLFTSVLSAASAAAEDQEHRHGRGQGEAERNPQFV